MKRAPAEVEKVVWDEWKRLVRETGQFPRVNHEHLYEWCFRFMESARFRNLFAPETEQTGVVESFFWTLGVMRCALHDCEEQRDRLAHTVTDLLGELGDAASLLGQILERAKAYAAEVEDAHRLVPVMDQLRDLIVALDDKRKAQQAGNDARRVVDDGYLEEASRRHIAGEPWKAIAPDYSLSPARLRTLVRKAGLRTRGTLRGT